MVGEQQIILGAAIFGSAVILFVLISLGIKVRRLEKKLHNLLRGRDGSSLEELLCQVAADQEILQACFRENKDRLDEVVSVLETATRGVGLVRFNAFQETGSDLSYAVAFLDATGSGIVISSIYGREESRSYAKPVVKGESSYQLGKEEKEAIKRAVNAVKAIS